MKNILFVEDNQDLLEIYSQLFSMFGNVDSFNNSQDAIEIISKKKYDLLISDYEIDEKTGLDICNVFKEHNDSPTIILSGYVDLVSVEKENSVDTIISKGTNTKDIISVVKSCLEGV